uniref:Uncharacterized protein n=1 Tax=Sphaerodactylus townsendi TaxID=933632 RepID=A0ACB8F541_9SAUR
MTCYWLFVTANHSFIYIYHIRYQQDVFFSGSGAVPLPHIKQKKQGEDILVERGEAEENMASKTSKTHRKVHNMVFAFCLRYEHSLLWLFSMQMYSSQRRKFAFGFCRDGESVKSLVIKCTLRHAIAFFTAVTQMVGVLYKGKFCPRVSENFSNGRNQVRAYSFKNGYISAFW